MIPGYVTRLSESAINNQPVAGGMTFKATTDIILLWAGGDIKSITPGLGTNLSSIVFLLPINAPVNLLATGNIFVGATIPIYRMTAMVWSKHTQKWHVAAIPPA